MLVNDASFGEAMAFLENCPVLAVDTETTGLHMYKDDRICGISVAAPPRSFYFPFRHGNGENISMDKLPALIGLIASKPWYGWNAGFDIKFLAQDGLPFPLPVGGRAQVEDVMLAAHLCDENEASYGLKELATKYLGPGCAKDENELRSVIESRWGKTNNKSWKGQMWKLEPELVAAYAESDVTLTWRMRDFYMPALKAWGMVSETRDLYNELCLYMQLFARMENEGLHIDTDRLVSNRNEAIEIRIKNEAAIKEAAGGAITNVSSPLQINKYLGRSSTRAEHLQYELAGHPLAKLLLAYRSADKVIGTYYDKWEDAMTADGKIHPSFNLIGTYTGRLSCSNPNLMAVPRYDDEPGAPLIRRVKEVAIASPGCELVEFDLSQAELRIASHYGAKALQRSTNEHYQRLVTQGPHGLLSPMGRILMSGADLHQETADLIGCDRSMAKRINFSAVFGIGYRKFSMTYHVPEPESKKHLAAWRDKFPEFMELLNQLEAEAQTRGYIVLESGRVRRFPNDSYKTSAASSNYVQGTVAEIQRKGMLRIDAMRNEGVKLLLQVHDSNLIEVPIDRPPDLLERIRSCMTGFQFSPSVGADGKIGDRWSSLSKIPA